MYKFYFYAVDKKEPNKLLALTDRNNRKSYSEITLPDQEWIEDYELQEYLMNEEYNYVNTKYLDMNIMYKLTQMIFDASLLFKMITDKKNEIAHLKLYLPKLFPDIEVPLFDAVVLCMALIAKNNHMLGNIIWEPSKVMAVLGYNFEADFDKLRREIMNDPHMKDSRLATMIPNVNIADYRDINTLFLKINALEEYLTKKMAEDLTDYLKEMGVKVKYMHSDIKTLERTEIIRDLRLGVFDVLVGINLLREGIDVPEVSLVAILDADKEGFLRNERGLIQTIGRAARNSEGHVIMYADTMTQSMQRAIDETARRRKIQMAYNEEHGIVPQTIKKEIRDLIAVTKAVAKEEDKEVDINSLNKQERKELVKKLEKQMQEAVEVLDFELAAQIRDMMLEVKALD